MDITTADAQASATVASSLSTGVFANVSAASALLGVQVLALQPVTQQTAMVVFDPNDQVSGPSGAEQAAAGGGEYHREGGLHFVARPASWGQPAQS